ncbi:hypothetical protein BJ322DRAFT_21450 [Thelephora terrestris]|uniref:Uncharacterized protein n=1 Tax=Thelephora terrestris TaxID=56493 RepID=A0A9P6HPA3_9AGAM|nr:hypothetical protein BJ322DRAFT_21450 [Thelephora terrestris]
MCVVMGLLDGLTVPFALTAGLWSLGDSRLVVLGVIAELIAGAISMGIGGSLASQPNGITTDTNGSRLLPALRAAATERSDAKSLKSSARSV